MELAISITKRSPDKPTFLATETSTTAMPNSGLKLWKQKFRLITVGLLTYTRSRNKRRLILQALLRRSIMRTAVSVS